jgi:hypothetical protein
VDKLAQDYDVEWFHSLAQYRRFNETALWGIFAHLGTPASYADFGCGDGWMVRNARMAGANPSIGIEGSGAVRLLTPRWARIIVHDLTKPIRLKWRFELVTSIEVGEHLPEEGADEYVKNLAYHTMHWLVFTAAKPGQGGYQHINCQPQEYWREKLEAVGFEYLLAETDRLRETWKWCTGPMHWLPENVQVFKKRPNVEIGDSDE